MGYTHGKRWTEEGIAKGIYEVMDFLGIDRMPSKREIEEYCGNAGLTCKISKTGGFYGWAKALGLEVKQTESLLGITFEQKMKDVLEQEGYACELTSTKHPYDILIDGRVKIDVKVANMSKVRGSDAYSFNLEKTLPTCDFYMAVCLTEQKGIKKVYVIPSSVMYGKKQLCIGIAKTRYDRYRGRYDLIKTLGDTFKRLEAV